MSYVSKDELCDTVADAQRDLERVIDKLGGQLDAVELRMERNIASVAKKAAASAIMSKEFQHLQEEILELKDDLHTFGKSIKLLWAAVEDLSLDANS